IISTGNYVDDIDTAVQNKNQQLSKEFKRKSMEIAGIILLSLVGMSVVAIFVSRGIASPILKLVEAFEKDENGQIRIQETHIRSRDEVGKLGKTLNVLSEQIREFINGVAAESEHVSQSAILVRSNIMELNQEITEISASTQEIAAGAEETTAISQNMSERSAQLLHASKEMKEEARQATNSVQEMNHRADQLKAEFEMAVENSTKIMNEAEIKLTKATKEAQAVERVSELADIIVQITEQTNLLALNAAIEAARAGEAGKGFAVVAEEIRKLADDSKETVVKIQEVILQIVSGVDTLKVNANELLSFLSTDVKRDYESMLQASDAYSLDTRQLEGVVVGFTKRANELERAMEDMAKAMEEISISTYEGAKGSGNISQSVETVSVQTEQLLTQAEVSSQYAKNLLQLIGKFKV
ncbi:MAG: methyl-accepting chemotaxis protein, partial [Clostridiales bacterium]|nr:methyl-accepting chemotaxis protein [Clostridiales bacterium]